MVGRWVGWVGSDGWDYADAIKTNFVNKKVLLRERKRHTDRCVSSTPSAVLSRSGRYLGWGWGVGTLAGGG